VGSVENPPARSATGTGIDTLVNERSEPQRALQQLETEDDMHVTQRHFPAALTLLLVCSFAACKAKEQNASGDAAVNADTTAAKRDSAARTAMAPGATTTPSTSAGWTSPSILGYAVAANSGEVELGKLGMANATSPAVKAFAKQMVDDHQAMLNESKALATKIHAVADSSANDARDLANHARDEINDLNGKTKGADWDKNFMDKMVDDHQKVLDKLQDAAKNTTDTELRTALEKATGKVQAHLTKAQDIKSHLKS
jgi:putative membrane protein